MTNNMLKSCRVNILREKNMVAVKHIRGILHLEWIVADRALYDKIENANV